MPLPAAVCGEMCLLHRFFYSIFFSLKFYMYGHVFLYVQSVHLIRWTSIMEIVVVAHDILIQFNT